MTLDQVFDDADVKELHVYAHDKIDPSGNAYGTFFTAKAVFDDRSAAYLHLSAGSGGWRFDKEVTRAPPVEREVVPKPSRTSEAEVKAQVKEGEVEGKEPWEIKQADWIDGHIKSPGLHGEHVRLALAAGKPVPAEVLADYPDLKQKMEAVIGIAQRYRSPKG